VADLSHTFPVQHCTLPPSDGIALFLTRYEVAGWMAQAERMGRRTEAARRRPKAAEKRNRELARAERTMDAESFAAWTAEREYEAEQARFFIERRKEAARYTRDRFIKGYQHHKEILIGGQEVPSFREKGLRSDRMGAAAKLFVAGTRKGRLIRGANDKAVMSVHWTKRKVHALDLPWIEGNRAMVTLMRIDLDRIFMGGISELVWELEQLVGVTLPCLPHLVAGGGLREKEYQHLPEDKRPLIRPHLWFILPPGSAVVATGKGRKRIVDFLGGVQRGLCHALIHLGADPNAPILSVRGKNPLSPQWNAADLNNEVFPSLSEYAEYVRTGIGREELTRIAAEAQSTVGKEASNVAFTKWQKEAYTVLHGLRSVGDAEYMRCIESNDREGLAMLLHDRLNPADLVEKTNWLPKDVAAILGHVVSYAAGAWDHERGGERRVKRGAMRHLISDDMTTDEKRQAAGAYAGKAKADKALDGIVAAIRAVEASGERVTKAAVARASGLHRVTVVRRWDDAMAVIGSDRMCSNRCVDIKPPVSSGATERKERGKVSRPVAKSSTRRGSGNNAWGFVRPSFLRDRTASVTDAPDPAGDEPPSPCRLQGFARLMGG